MAPRRVVIAVSRGKAFLDCGHVVVAAGLERRDGTLTGRCASCGSEAEQTLAQYHVDVGTGLGDATWK